MQCRLFNHPGQCIRETSLSSHGVPMKCLALDTTMPRNGYVVSEDGTLIKWHQFGGQTSKFTVVLCNAVGMSYRIFSTIIVNLSKHYRVITWESRGLPNSQVDLPETRLQLEHHARDCSSILSTLGIEHASFIGWSNGAKILAEFFRQQPEAVSGMVFINGAFVPGEVQHETKFHRTLAALIRRARGNLTEPFRRSVVSILQSFNSDARRRNFHADSVVDRPVVNALGRGTASESDEYEQSILDFRKLGTVTAFRNYLLIHDDLDRRDVSQVVASSNKPSLFICGALDTILHPSNSIEMQLRTGHSEIFVVERGRHGGFGGDNNRVCSRICNFLAKLERSDD